MTLGGLNDEKAATGSDQFRSRVSQIEGVLNRWLQRPSTAISCGTWSDGAIAEFIHDGRATLMPEAYDGCFSGVRLLRFDAAAHHMHIDLGRVHAACYTVSPSICFSGSPSFEVRYQILGPGGAPSPRWSVATMLRTPYRDGVLDDEELAWFAESVVTDLAATPDVVRFEMDPAMECGEIGERVRSALAAAIGLADAAPWSEVRRFLAGPDACVSRVTEAPTPLVKPLLDDALQLDDACLVLFRDRLLVELQTDRLSGVHRYEEAGHVSWQIGDSDDHHCHLALGAVTGVEFTADPSPCQRGRANYTVWFTVPAVSGNPYRSDGYFSVVLNRPYDGDRARSEVIAPVFDLYRRYAEEPWVTANDRFREELAACLA